MLEANLEDRKREGRLVSIRALIAGLLATAALSLVVVRLMHLQVDQHDHFTVLSRDNRVKVQPLPPARGLIYDAKGVLLADNHPSFSLEITIEKVGDLDATIDKLSRLIGIAPQDRARFERQKRQRVRFQGVPIRLNLTPTEVARFAVDGHRFPGVDIRAELVRTYPLGEYTAHVLGYVGRINEQELDRIDKSNYAGSHFIGKGGLEKAHEALLHGQVGYQQVEVNARGRVIRTLESQPPVSGKDLHLYLDIGLQQVAKEALGEERGAVVAIDPRNGGVLALVSNPSFDPNLFVEGISQTDYQALLSSPDKPLYNRAVRGQYPPGSTIKQFVALAGLASGVTTSRRATYCSGAFSLPGHSHRFRCWRRGGHGALNLEQALVQSCDVYFYDLANRMGIDRLSGFLSDFGFGTLTGIDVAGELGGLMPTREWKQRVRKQAWYPGETLIVGIGQGSFLATPLQLAVATAAVANHGKVIRPQVARAAQTPGAPAAEQLPMVSHTIELGDKQQWDQIIEAMAKVVESGTARRIRSTEYRIAGKTGTSQVFSLGQNQRYNAATLPKHLKDHALFVAFAPVDDPRIAIAVIVENGGGGGATAAPVARRIMDAYLGGATVLTDVGGERGD
ncbi:penicillin-binding protein 2 [Thiocapsa roseopersicina]|uniref:Peptidoglycan D,D-transpeptidase MrdA n=1 Tax=Thiocapsa roseopersicina TaxID=1058 RepID=A0A1H3CXI9_THIRO|nr:penicillin-binding protein 2 [Thiocapsa roseopersicina]SDX58760.1 penicillin-binding protein 2 [Thiocapsa roseopersicina]